MNTKVLFIIIACVAVAGIGFWLSRESVDYAAITNYEQCAAAGYPIMESYPEQCKTPDGRTFVRVIATELSDLIRVDAPTINALVSSPLLISGQARGNWYFEASFPAQLLDANGVVLFEGPIQADGEWMTPEFVPFSQEIVFALPKTPTGTLVLKKDNPSGLSEHDKELRIPVRFQDVLYPIIRKANFNESATLKIGEVVEFGGYLQVRLEKIEDSRCKPDVQCIWAGELRAFLIVGELAGNVYLGTMNEKSSNFSGHILTLDGATENTATITVQKVAATKNGEVKGYVHMGPTCPVERVPADPECADKPYTVSIEIHYPDERLHSIIKSGADGRFLVTLPTGEYILRPQAANVLPSCEEKRVTVLESKTIEVDMSCDSGIR